MSIVLILACGAVPGGSTPSPSLPAPPPPPSALPAAQSPAPPPSAPAAPPPPSDPRLAALMAAAAEVKTEAEFEALIKQARQIAEPHAGAFCRSFELDLTGVPLLTSVCDDVSQSITVALPAAGWLPIARRTPSPADDAYVEVMGQARGQLGGTQLLVYGGDCVVLDAVASRFAAVVAAPAPENPGGLLASELETLRQELFTHLTAGDYCSGDDEVIQARARGLLKLKGLTAEERADLEASLPTLTALEPEELGGD